MSKIGIGIDGRSLDRYCCLRSPRTFGNGPVKGGSMDKRWYERVIWLSLLLIVIVIMVGKASLDKQTGHQATNSITQTILDQKRVLADADEHVKTCKEAVHVCDDALRDCKHELIRAMSADPSAPATTQPSRTAKRVKHKR